MVGGDATAMPFGDEVFDRVIAAEVLEHVPGDQCALAEIARLLRPGGLLAVTVPAWLPERICWQLSADYHNTPGGHVRIYTRPGLEAKLRAAGLVVGGHHHAHALHSPYWWLKCAVGVHDDAHPLARAYHRMLVWDITRRPAVTRAAERLLNPLIGKSLVLYARKPGDRAPEPHVPLRETQHDRLPARTRAGACGPGPACAQILTAPPRPAHQRRWQIPVMAWRSLGRRRATSYLGDARLLASREAGTLARAPGPRAGRERADGRGIRRVCRQGPGKRAIPGCVWAMSV